MKIIAATLVVALLSLSTALGQQALRQRSNTRGLNVGLYTQYTSWGTTSDDFKDFSRETSGVGIGLRAGFGFSHRVEAFGQLDYSALATPRIPNLGINMLHLELGGRLNIGSTTSRVRPFVDLGFSAVGATASPVASGNLIGDAGFYGQGLMAGAGLNYFLTIPLALNLRYNAVLGSFSTIEFEGRQIPGIEKPTIGTNRISLGLSWYLRGRR